MSLFRNGGGLFSLLTANDDSAMDLCWRWNALGRRGMAPFTPGLLWSRSLFTGMAGGSDAGLMFGMDASDAAVWEAPRHDEGGGATQKKIIGTTRDSSGNPLGSCVVQGFLTANDIYVGEVTSDTGGYFVLPTIFSGAHYLVAYKPGSPDVAGTTVNTLIPV